jgi:hypothetical protein
MLSESFEFGLQCIQRSSAPDNRTQTAAVSVSYFGHHNTMIQRRKISGLGTSVRLEKSTWKDIFTKKFFSSILSGSRKKQPIIAFVGNFADKLHFFNPESKKQCDKRISIDISTKLNYNVLKREQKPQSKIDKILVFHELVRRLKSHQEKESRAERRSQLMQLQTQFQFV